MEQAAMTKLCHAALLAALHEIVRRRFKSLTATCGFFNSDARAAYYGCADHNNISFTRMLQMFDALGYQIEFKVTKKDPVK
jgi:hypothetical protein